MSTVPSAESLMKLPELVAFKGPNGKYLKVLEVPVSEAMIPIFSSTGKEIPESWFETSTDGDGRVQIKSMHYNKYLKCNTSSNSVVVDSAGDVDSTDLSNWFWPIKLDASTVALKSLSNDRFCSLHSSSDGVTDILNASSTSITNSSRFTIEETVISRSIYNTVFELNNARIYGETTVTGAVATASNNSSQDQTVELRFSYDRDQRVKWTSSDGSMVGFSVTADLKVPLIVSSTQVIATEVYSGPYVWGETIRPNTTVVEFSYRVTVPANSSVTVRLMGTMGTCDVQFSYYQRDVLYNGQTVIYQKDNGLSTGSNTYNVYYEVTFFKNQESTSDLPDPWVYPNKVQKIPLPGLSGTTTVQTPVNSTTETVA